MNKLMSLIVVALVIGLSARFAFAEETKGARKEDGMDGGMMKMMHKMHGMTRSSSMVASNDGGVIVLSGNKLYKYDKNLNLVKEAEIKTEMGCMGGMRGGMGMGGMKKMCPMCAKMKGKDDTIDEAAEGEADQPAEE